MARAAGIAVIYQEPTLFPDLTVAENMFIGRQPLRAGRRIDRRAMRAEAAAIFARLGVQLDPARIARGLSIADQQVVEIGKALSLEARVIVMDEPTAALSAAEVDRLFDVVRALRASGAAVLFISHRLEEVFALCQRVTVMRDGKQVLTQRLDGLVADDLVRAMVGRELAERPGEAHGTPGEPLLERGAADPGGRVHRRLLHRPGRRDRRAGRAGGLGAQRGRPRRLRHRPVRRGLGDGARAGTPPRLPDRGHGGRGRLRARGPPPAGPGHGHVRAAERGAGLAAAGSGTGGLIRAAAERALAADWADRLKIKYGRLSDPVSMLSGGNQQKVVLAKWLGRKPVVLIVDEPTRGIDVATKAEVHHLLLQLARDGVGILMISSELPEVLRISDRILVMREGRLVAEFAHAGRLGGGDHRRRHRPGPASSIVEAGQ